MTRIKPFPYDVLETQTSLTFVVCTPECDGGRASYTIAPNGLQVDRPDGSKLRFGNLHPRLQIALQVKNLYVCEAQADIGVLYPLGTSDAMDRPFDLHLGSSFYWYFGPETSTLLELSQRPAAHVLAQINRNPTAVAPGDPEVGALIGLCYTTRGFVPLAPGRRWSQARPGLIVDMGLATGCTTGYPVGDDIEQSVAAAHFGRLDHPQDRPRRPWHSQIACVFPAA